MLHLWFLLLHVCHPSARIPRMFHEFLIKSSTFCSFCHPHLREVSKARSSWTPVCSQTKKTQPNLEPSSTRKLGFIIGFFFFSSFYSNLKYFPKKIKAHSKADPKMLLWNYSWYYLYIYVYINCWLLSLHFWYLFMVKLPLLLVNGFPFLISVGSPFSLVHIPMLGKLICKLHSGCSQHLRHKGGKMAKWQNAKTREI